VSDASICGGANEILTWRDRSDLRGGVEDVIKRVLACFR